MTKVMLPKEVAEAIEGLRSRGASDATIFYHAVKEEVSAGDFKTVQMWACKEDKGDLLMEALVNGFEAEETPEELLLKRYKELAQKYQTEPHHLDTPEEFRGEKDKIFARMCGIAETLDILGIAIEGINS